MKDIVTRDFEWLDSVWRTFCRERGRSAQPLLDAMRERADGDLDEGQFVDRVERALARGQVIALIVGDGIESRLQQLVSHLCRDSAHLRYSLGLVALRCYQMPDHDEMLVLPDLVQEVEPVERAFVRIELDSSLPGHARITSVMEEETADQSAPVPHKRITLTEDALYDSLERAVGVGLAERVRRFVDETSEIGIEPEFKSAALMLKVPDPSGEHPGASLLAIEKSGRVYNPNHGPNQVKRWGWSDAAVDRTVGACFRNLHALDPRFPVEGISHGGSRDFLPLQDVVEKLPAIKEVLKEAVAAMEREAEKVS